MDIKPPSSSTASAQNTLSGGLGKEMRALLAALQSKVGTVLEAKVTKIVTVSKPELALLLTEKQNDPTLSQQTKSALTQLLKQPSVRLVDLAVHNRPVPTLTSQPLQIGQKVLVAIRQDGQLQLLDAPTRAPTSPASPTTYDRAPQTSQTPLKPDAGQQSQPPQSQVSSKLRPAAQTQSPSLQATNQPALKTLAEPQNNTAAKQVELGAKHSTQTATAAATAPRNTPLSNTILNSNPALRQLPQTIAEALTSPPPQFKQLQNHIAQEMRSALPNANTLSRTLQTLGVQLDKAVIDTLPLNQVKALSSLAAAITKMVNLTSMPSVSPSNIKQAIENSGVFQERVLALNANATDTNTNLDKLKSDDLKSVLTQLLNSITTPASSQTSLNPAIKTTVDQLLLALFGGFGKASAAETKTHSGSDPKLLLQQLSQSALSRIQLNQYRTLSSMLGSSAEQLMSSPTLHLDIPVRWGEYLGNIFFLFQEIPPKPEEKEKQKKQTKKSSRWRVFMELELDEAETLAVEVSSSEHEVGAKFWASTDSLRQKTQDQLMTLKDDLERQGLTVTDLSCTEEPPPKQDVKLDYALIDIKT